ncbi:hypothetical protein AB0L99_25290 [Streptomyces sp. NPDC051954]|uniref:hypothetical protein n=1 Tax=Streptomyces sp. NPDC051954 TaxID=3155524 RepID=UPI003444DD82
MTVPGRAAITTRTTTRTGRRRPHLRREGPEIGRGSGSLVAGVLFLGLFVWIETRVDQPLLPMRVVRDRNRGAACLMVAIGGI